MFHGVDGAAVSGKLTLDAESFCFVALFAAAPNVSRVRGMHVQGTPVTKHLPLDGGQLYPQDDD